MLKSSNLKQFGCLLLRFLQALELVKMVFNIPLILSYENLDFNNHFLAFPQVLICNVMTEKT